MKMRVMSQESMAKDKKKEETVDCRKNHSPQEHNSFAVRKVQRYMPQIYDRKENQDRYGFLFIRRVTLELFRCLRVTMRNTKTQSLVRNIKNL